MNNRVTGKASAGSIAGLVAVFFFYYGVGLTSPSFAITDRSTLVSNALDNAGTYDQYSSLLSPQPADFQAVPVSLQPKAISRVIPSVVVPGMAGSVVFKDPAAEIADTIVIDSLDLKDMNIPDVLKLLAEKSGLNIIAGQGVQGRISIYLREVKLKDALRVILDANQLAYRVSDGIILVMPASEFESRYGYKFGGNLETRIFQLQYASAMDVEAGLNQMKSPSGRIISSLKAATVMITENPEVLKVMESLIRAIDVPVETAIFPLSYAQAESIAAKVSEALTLNEGKVKFDVRSNTVIVTDTPNHVQDIKRIIESFDVKEEQVLIEAKIVQVVLSDRNKFGVNWEALFASSHGFDIKSKFDILGDSEKRGQVSIGTVADDNYSAVLQALESEGDTNILSSPSITTINNKEAKILVGSTQPYVTTTTTTPSSGPSTVAEDVKFIDVGVKLYVTPTIHKDGFITMKINPEVSSVTSSINTSNNNVIPIVESSQAETTVMVKHGMTIIIGGLIKEERIRSVNRVPVLGAIPVVGNAFKNTDDQTRKTEIVIFLTPKIITGDSSITIPVGR